VAVIVKRDRKSAGNRESSYSLVGSGVAGSVIGGGWSGSRTGACGCGFESGGNGIEPGIWGGSFGSYGV